ncbi:PSP1 domain-containing protein [Collinsella tanakaei]|uniref:PSP1 domain-containing protein n=1 Tax=Collinsella tanakaei TaxID=626935 RepID=UPI00265B0A50|nr:regulatory iron-sulfur-containing complex subunit RicT [Collinsella tanakaei]
MPVVVPVKFAFASRDLWFDPQGIDVLAGDHAICSTERGTEIGLVTADPFDVPASELAAPLKPVLRVASDEDLDHADDLARMGEDAMYDFRRLVEQNELDMKPVGVEYLFGGEKAVFYFAAEDRVDFRQLVRDLSAFFHIRVDMRQIGVRDETRLIGGYATCGQELCCARFGGQFEPVSIRMAKEQDLPLNSSKISGACGRLMCCLRYEFEAYKDFKSRAPKKKAIIDTPLGKARVQEYNTPREELILRLESGKVFRVSLADMTCSDSCKKKSAESGCSSCRPDCVTRDVLEKIESPDIALALLELDRERGVDVGDGLDRADRIVASGPTPRRRRMREEEAAKFGGGAAADKPKAAKSAKAKQAKAVESAPEGATPRRRRRRNAGEAADQAAQQGQQRTSTQGQRGPARSQASDQQAQPSRRRRRHLSGEERDDAFRAAAMRDEVKRASKASEDKGEGASTKSRRKHTAQKPDVPSVAEQLSSGKVKVTRRRPGDGGGAAAEKKSPAPQDGSRQDAAPDQQAQKRRRRRRSRKPKQDGGASNGDGASSSAE